MSATMIKVSDIETKAKKDAAEVLAKQKATSTDATDTSGKTYTDEDAKMWVGVAKAMTKSLHTKQPVNSKNWDREKAQSEDTDSDGGHGVYDELERALYRGPSNALVIADKVTTRQGNSNLYQRTRVLSGLTGQWTGEGEAITDHTIKFDTQQIVPYKFTEMNIQSSEVLEDWALTPDLAQEVVEEIQIKFAEERERVIFNGTGSTGKQPIGILATANVARVHSEGALISEAASIGVNEVTFENVQKTYDALHQRFQRSAVWFCNKALLPALRKLTDNITGNKPWVNGWAQQTPRETAVGQAGWLMDLPVYTTDDIGNSYTFANTNQANAKATALILCDPRQYLIYERRGLQISVSDQYRFANDQITTRGTQRYGGDMWEQKGFAILSTKGKA